MMTHIRCSNCNVNYRLPTNLSNDQPRKLRCAKCKTVFSTQAESISPNRQSEPTPLRESMVTASVPPPLHNMIPRLDDEDDAVTGIFRISAPPPLPPLNPQMTAAANTVLHQQAPQLTVGTNTVPHQQGPQTTVGTNAVPYQQEQQITVGTNTVPNDDTALEVTDFSPQIVAPTFSSFMGKVMFGLTLCIAISLAFVAYRNGWDLSLGQLDKQFAFAFSGQILNKGSEEVEGLEVAMQKSRVLFTEDRIPILITTGMVFNNSPFQRSHIVLRAALYDDQDNLLAEVDFPCGTSFESEILREIHSADGIPANGENDQHANCYLDTNGSKKFKLSLPVPHDHENLPRVEVYPYSAKPYQR